MGDQHHLYELALGRRHANGNVSTTNLVPRQETCQRHRLYEPSFIILPPDS